jgi:hypothetical protein
MKKLAARDFENLLQVGCAFLRENYYEMTGFNPTALTTVRNTSFRGAFAKKFE